MRVGEPVKLWILCFVVFGQVSEKTSAADLENNKRSPDDKSKPICTSDKRHKERVKRGHISLKTSTWPNNEVRYYIMPQQFTTTQEKYIDDAANEWQDNTCLKFTRLQSPSGRYLKIEASSNCEADVGYQSSGEMVMQLSWYCRNGYEYILHEFGHVIGLLHEHSRNDRGGFVNVHTGNLHDASYLRFFTIELSGDSSKSTPYDLYSIMHYAGDAGSRDPNLLKTIDAKDNSYDSIIGKGKHASFYDFFTVNKLYNCGGSCNHKSCGSYQYHDKQCRCVCKGNTGIGTPTRLCLGECLTGFEKISSSSGLNEKCYKITDAAMTYAEAQSYCQSQESSVAVIESNNERSALQSWLSGKGIDRALIDSSAKDYFYNYNKLDVQLNFGSQSRRGIYPDLCISVFGTLISGSWNGRLECCSDKIKAVCKQTY